MLVNIIFKKKKLKILPTLKKFVGNIKKMSYAPTYYFNVTLKFAIFFFVSEKLKTKFLKYFFNELLKFYFAPTFYKISK